MANSLGSRDYWASVCGVGLLRVWGALNRHPGGRSGSKVPSHEVDGGERNPSASQQALCEGAYFSLIPKRKHPVCS